MTLSTGGGNFNPTPQTNYYDQVTTQDDLAKKGAIGLGNKVLILNDSLEVSFTDLNKNTLYQYSSEASKPTILPAGSFRAAGLTVTTSNEEIEGKFNQLFSKLPEELQKMVQEARDQDAIVLKDLLINASKMLVVQEKALAQTETADAQLHAEINTQLPTTLFRNMARVGKEFVENAKETMEQFTANDPNYLEAQDLIQGLNSLIDLTKFSEHE
ncbi:MAG: hypothetical protein ACSNEK_02365 [Parachlamydiaceae bacterium]